jgi:hypothetical protein
MVHNGIEYGDMQIISEASTRRWTVRTREGVADHMQAYDIMKRGLGMSYPEMADVFATWNKGVLDSFLIEITRDVLRYTDDDGVALVEKILDSAGQKGTGKWTAINALDLGMPVTLIGEAVFARCLSSLKAERVRASKVLDGPKPNFTGDRKEFIDNLEQAVYASKIISYAQGFMLIQNVRLALTSICSVANHKYTGCQGIQVEAEQAIHCSHVAWRLHHPLSIFEGYHKGLPRQPRSRKPAFQRFLQQGHSQGAAGLERRCQQGRSMGCPSSCFQHRA